MSELAGLIERLCPTGVKYLPLGELVDYAQPGKYLVSSTDYDPTHDTPVLTAGQTFVLGYTDETEGIYPSSVESPVVIFDDFTTAFKWVDFPFKAKSSAMKMLTAKSAQRASLRFIYFAMQTIRYGPRDHARQWIGTYSNFQVPVPPLEVQREIVRILDNFTELEAELEARRRQYASYKDKLFRNLSARRSVSLGDISFILNGFSFRSENYSNSGVRVIRISDVQKGYISDKDRKYYSENRELEYRRYSLHEGDLVLSLSGSVGRVAMLSESDLPAALNQRVACVRPDPSVLTRRFLFHFLNRDQFEDAAILSAGSGTVKNVSSRWLREYQVPLVPLNEQAQIVALLDHFDLLINDISVGLPAELAARRKQCEYYRDRLLTFEEAPA